MNDVTGRCVFFVRNAPDAVEYYTRSLGFSIDWTYAEQGKAFVVQVSLLGLQIILNQTEVDTQERPGHGRVFIGLDDARSAALLEHVKKMRISMAYKIWGQPTAVITDLDGNEIFIWLSDSERVKWAQQPLNAFSVAR